MRNWKYLFTLLLLILAGIAIAAIQFPDKYLHVIACNVGQGDAILIAYGQTQILTDGGPDNKVLDCLGRYMPFWDREIEVVISTHSDADHLTGLVSVLQNYKVDKLVINPINPGTAIYQALENTVGGGGIDVINPIAGIKIGIGLIHLDIVNPTEDLFTNLGLLDDTSKLSKYTIDKDTNTYSVTYLLSFERFTGLLPGDVSPKVSDSLAKNWHWGEVNYLKVPHHGSVNGLTENLLKEIKPEVAVISVGKNQWGLPKEEILSMLSRYNARVLRTDEVGDVVLLTDGEKYWIK